jgi:hypothetical protein
MNNGIHKFLKRTKEEKLFNNEPANGSMVLREVMTAYKVNWYVDVRKSDNNVVPHSSVTEI